MSELVSVTPIQRYEVRIFGTVTEGVSDRKISVREVYPCVTYVSKTVKKRIVMNGQISYAVSVSKLLKTVLPNTHTLICSFAGQPWSADITWKILEASVSSVLNRELF